MTKQNPKMRADQDVPGVLPPPERRFFRSDITYRRSVLYVKGWNARCKDLYRKAKLAGENVEVPSSSAPQSYPSIGSVWTYKGNQARLYEVMHLANIEHLNDAHPPSVVYRTCSSPGHIWVRTVESFYSRFAPSKPRRETGALPLQEGTLRLEDVAHTIVRVDYEGTDGNEAYDAQFDGVHRLYCVCSPETDIDQVSTTESAIFSLVHQDACCTVIEKHVI